MQHIIPPDEYWISRLSGDRLITIVEPSVAAAPREETMNADISCILSYLYNDRGINPREYQWSGIERIIKTRLSEQGISRAQDYINVLETDPEEWQTLISRLTIHVSEFFRNPVTFEVLAEIVLPALMTRKLKTPCPCIRVWSSGCACGEEAFSMAILLKDFFKTTNHCFDVRIFATDINRSVLKKAGKGTFDTEQLENVKLKHLNRYFTRNSGRYQLDPSILDMVSFSYYDILDTRTYVPPESVFGNFDLVLCRNLLIYFQQESRTRIFDKLFRALASGAYLVLGEAESLPEQYHPRFSRELGKVHIYQKHQ